MNRFRMMRGVTPTLLAITVLVTALLMEWPFDSSLAAQTDAKQDSSAADLLRDQVAIAQLQLSIQSQEITIANIEREIAEALQQAAEQKVASVVANLEAAEVEYSNTAKLFKEHVVSDGQVALAKANRASVEAEVKMAQAHSTEAQKTTQLKQAQIELLKLHEKVARTRLQNLQRKAGAGPENE